MKNILIAIILLISTDMLGQNQHIVGSISILKGYGWILRRVPQNVESQNLWEGIKRVERDGYEWFQFPIQYHKNLAYGDRIEIPSQGRAIIKSDYWGELHVGANSSIHIVPNFETMIKARMIYPMFELERGIIRVQANNPGAHATVSVQVPQGQVISETGDFIVHINKVKTKIFSLDGSLDYRYLRLDQVQLVDDMRRHYLTKNFEQLAATTMTFSTSKMSFLKTLGKGEKLIMRRDRIEQITDLNDLGSKIVARSIREKDYRLILSVLYSPSELASVMENTGDTTIKQEAKQQVRRERLEKKKNGKQEVSVRLAGVALRSQFNDQYQIPAEGAGIELSWRPLSFIYSNFGITRGTIDISGIANVYGNGEPKRLNLDYHITHINAGLYYDFANCLETQIGYGMIDGQDEVFQYKSPLVEGTQTYTLSFEKIPYWEIGMTYRFQRSWEIFANYGEGEVTSVIREEDNGDRYGVDLDIKFGRIGIGQRF